MANTIADKLTYLNGTKDAIKQAIIGKGVDVSDTDTFRSYADKITSIQSGGSSGTGSLVTGTKLAYSTFSTIPNEYILYLEQQTDMGYMFSDCKSLQTVPLFNTSNVTTMDYMFYFCKSLKTVPLFDTSNVTTMGYMFRDCRSLQTVPQFVTSKCNNMSDMFGYCEKLKTVPKFDTSKVNDMNWMFSGCSSLTNLGGFTGLKINLDLSSSRLLTIDSIMNVINNAANMSSSPKTLTLHKNVFNRLSEEQIATANAKGWNIGAIE